MDNIIDSDDCILMLLAYKNFVADDDSLAKKALKDLAKELSSEEDDFGRYWLFIYEVLPKSLLKGQWKALKNHRVSFCAI